MTDIFLPKTDLRKWLGIEPKRRPPLNWYVAKRPDKGILKTSKPKSRRPATADKPAANPETISDFLRPPPGFGERVTKGTPLTNPQHPIARIAAAKAARLEAEATRKALDSMTRKIMESRRLKAAGLI